MKSSEHTLWSSFCGSESFQGKTKTLAKNWAEREQKRHRASILKVSNSKSIKEFKPNPSLAQNNRQIEYICCKLLSLHLQCDTFAEMTLGEKKGCH